MKNFKRLFAKQSEEQASLTSLQNTLESSQKHLLAELKTLAQANHPDATLLDKMSAQLTQLIDYGQLASEQTQQSFAKLQPSLEKILTEQQETNYRQQFIFNKLEEMLEKQEKNEMHLEAIQSQINKLTQKAEEEKNQLNAMDQLLQEFKADSSLSSKEGSSDAKKEVPEDIEIKKINSSQVQKFYVQFKLELERFFIMAQKIQNQEIAPGQSTLKTVTSGARTLSELIPLPYAGLVVNLLTSAIEAADAKRETDKAKSTCNIVNQQEILAKVAYAIAYKYQRQLDQLTDTGIKQLAECARKRVFGHIIAIDQQRLTGNLSVPEKVELLSYGVIEGNPSNLINTKIETKDNKNWRAEGFFKRTGLELVDGQRFVIQDSQKGLRKNALVSKPEKYGFRLGDEKEKERYQFKTLYPNTPMNKPSQPSSLAAPTLSQAQLTAKSNIVFQNSIPSTSSTPAHLPSITPSLTRNLSTTAI